MKKTLFWSVALIAIGAYFYNNPIDWANHPTSRSHHGTADLFMQGTLKGSVGEMKSYCKDAAVDKCQPILDEIRALSPNYSKYSIEMGGLGQGNRTSGHAVLIGGSNTTFMTLSFDLEEENGEWKIYELTAAKSGE